jgi:1-phosphofructokinase family hexose kinase
MILCVTLNPCLDKTLIVPPWRPGDSVRGRAMHAVVGGKGNNVARALTRLGRRARPATFFGGSVGDDCEALLRRDDGLDPLVIPTQAPTRVILTVRTESTAEQSAFFDPDPAVTQTEADAMLQQVEAELDAGRVSGLTLSGSSPSPATHGLYGELIRAAKSRDIPAFLDTYGPALDAVQGVWPTTIQLNRREARGHLHDPSAGDAAIHALLDRWAGQGVACAIVTDGPNPVLVHCRGRRYRVIPPAIDVVNPIGSGDCLLAALVDGWIAGLSDEAMIRHAVACAVANSLVWDAAAIEPGEVRKQEPAIIIERLQA